MNEETNGWGRYGVAHIVQAVLRAIGVALGLFMLAISIPLFFLPIPLGLPLAVFALILLAATSKTAHRAITGWLRRHPAVWERVKHFFDRGARD
ncbi:MAG: hypothetical protein JJU18_06195 [Oceanicaulis sp.]|nr:hypothetical protein [Oceanicaulis sp.]